MSNEPTDASSSPGIPPEVPATSPPLSGDVQELLAVADQVLSLERKHEHMEKAEGDEALEWHEVIELQAFIERKAWIEEKTKVCMKSVLEACITAFLNACVVPGAATSHRGLCRHGGRTRIRHRGSRPSHTRTAARMGD